MEDQWELTLIRCGRITANTNAPLLGREPGAPVELPIWMGAVTDGKVRVLIDTGIGEDLDEIVAGPEPNCLQGPGEHTAAALKRAVGWGPEDVDIVINTHLHYDHCGGNRLFSNARFYVQRREWEAAKDPKGDTAYLYWPKYLSGPDMPPERWVLLDGEKELLPGLRVFPTPGHTPGHQSVLLSTGDGALCYVGDAVSVLENLTEDVVTSIHVDPEQSLKSYAEIRRRADQVIPGHDYRLREYSHGGFVLK